MPKVGASFEDPHDFSQLHDGIAAALSRLRDELSKMRVGGRFNTVSIENLRVQLSKSSKESIKLGDLAQVVPKGGRMVTILASDEEVSYWRLNCLCCYEAYRFPSKPFSFSL